MRESLRNKLQAHIAELQSMQSDVESGAAPDAERLGDVVEQIVTDMPELAPVIQALIDTVERDHG